MGDPMANLDDDDAGHARQTVSGLTTTGGALAYVIGPIRGRLAPLRDLIAQLLADALAAKPAAKPHLIFLGDYLGAAAGSAEVVAFILDLKTRPIFQVHALQGRSDRALTNFLEFPAADAPWIVEGDGAAILQSVGVTAPSPRANVFAWNDAADALRAVMPQDSLAFLRKLETLVSVGDYAFVHGGLRPELAEDQVGGAGEIQWIRGSPFRQDYTMGQAKGRPRTGAGPALYGLRLQDTRQAIFSSPG